MNELISEILKASFWGPLIGVFVGALGVTANEWFKDQRNRKQHRAYAAVRIVCALDDFVKQCRDVATDEGNYQKEHHGEDERHTTVSLPSQPAFADDIDWKSINPKLAYRVLSLASRIDDAEGAISFAGEHSFAPDYEEVFEERQWQFADIGIAALGIASELRRQARLPNAELGDQSWSPEQKLPKIKAKIEERRRKRNASGSNLLTDV